MEILSLLQTILAFILAFSILVVVHEMGHYLAARWCNVKVLRFSLGWGNVLWSRRFGKDQTEWAISPLPLGGYVKMLDLRDPDQSVVSEEDKQREFTQKNVWARIFITAAGPLANFLLAIAIFALLNTVGVPEPSSRLRVMPESSQAYQAGLRGGQKVIAIDGEPVQLWSQLRSKLLLAALEKKRVVLDVESRQGEGAAAITNLASVSLSLDQFTQAELEGDFMKKLGLEVYRPPAVLGKMEADSPAALAGMQSGDKILAINGKPVQDAVDFVLTVRANPEKALQIEVQRAAQELVFNVTPRGMTGPDKKTIGRLLVAIDAQPEMLQISRNLPTALWLAVTDTWDMSVTSVKMMAKMVTGQVSLRNLTGPITIADYAGQTAKIGWMSYLHFIAFISMSLGVMNLLPIPVLDGGYLLYYSLEILRGRPLPERFVELSQRAGFGFLIMLMAVAVFNDLARQIP